MGTGMSWLDVKVGLRMLAKYPALTLVGGLGIAVSVAVAVGFFAFMTASFFPTIPLDEGNRIVALENRDIRIDNEERRTLFDFVQWRSQLKSVVDLGAFRNVTRNLVTGDGAEGVLVAEMTASGFTVARVQPSLGRYLEDADEAPGAPPVVVIGHEEWRQRFAADPQVVGKTIRLDAVTYTIVGVMPDGFRFPMQHQFWTPLATTAAAYEPRMGPGIIMFGRLAPGVTMQEAQAELDVIGERSAAAHPGTHASLRPMVLPYVHSLTDIQGTTTWMLAQMQFMMTLLLIVVALNVAVLVYARTATRQGEIAVRTALGASRMRIVGQLFAEALVLSLGSAALGLGIAHFGIRLGSAIMQTELGSPFWADYSLRGSTVLFTVLIAVFAAVVVGVVPALQATGKRLSNNLRQLGGGTGIQLGKTWTTLIVAQVAIAVAALPAAVNLGWGQIRSATTTPNFPSEEFVMVGMSLDVAGASVAAQGTVDSTRFSNAFEELLRRLSSHPAVQGVTYAVELPYDDARIDVDGVDASRQPDVMNRIASERIAVNYFEVYGIQLLAGREFTTDDAAGAPRVVVVNRAFVDQVLGGGDAIGKRLRVSYLEGEGAAAQETNGAWQQVVGVYDNTETNVMDPSLVRPRVYFPVSPQQSPAALLQVRVAASQTAAFVPQLRQTAVSVEPYFRMGRTFTRSDMDRQGQLAMQLVALAIGLVLVSVFLLSAGGVYALTSFTVTRRRKEIGIRTALGAPQLKVLRTVFGRVARQVSLGIVVGVAAALLLEAATGGALLGGRATLLLPVFVVAMAAVAAFAALGPARRALRIQPTEALREE